MKRVENPDHIVLHSLTDCSSLGINGDMGGVWTSVGKRHDRLNRYKEAVLAFLADPPGSF